MVDNRLSFKGLMIAELGKIVGTYYVAESEAQYSVLHSTTLDLGHISVPEVLVLEDSPQFEPWHSDSFAILAGRDKFRYEAAEPWHVSLREKYKPDPDLKAWFTRNPAYEAKTPLILKKAYGLA
jgi:hypothetical protein